MDACMTAAAPGLVCPHTAGSIAERLWTSIRLGSGVDPALGMVLAPLAFGIVDALLEVQRRLGGHLGRNRDALYSGVPPGVLQALGGLHEDDILALQG